MVNVTTAKGTLKTCFVMQRFDGAVYDRRYRETFAPAIETAGAKPLRADEVLGTTPVISKIEAGLRGATVAFADVSEDNPNVFLELGYALSLNVPTVIVCDKAKRTKLPFDISHRPVLFYSTDAQSDFEKISNDIADNIRVALSEAFSRGAAISTTTEENDALSEDVRRACLLEILDQSLRSPTGTSFWDIQRKVVGPGINERMVALAVARLIDDGLIEKNEAYDNDAHERYVAINLTDIGSKYLLRSYSSLMKAEQSDFTSGRLFDDEADDVPF